MAKGTYAMSGRARKVNVRNKIWKAERPILVREIRRKGYKTNPFPRGSLPPQGYVNPTQLLHLLQHVDFKKAAKGFQRAYDRETRHNLKIPHGSHPRSGKGVAKRFSHFRADPEISMHRTPKAKKLTMAQRKALHMAPRDSDITFPEVHA